MLDPLGPMPLGPSGPGPVEPGKPGESAPREPAAPGQSFLELLKKSIDEVNTLQEQAGDRRDRQSPRSDDRHRGGGHRAQSSAAGPKPALAGMGRTQENPGLAGFKCIGFTFYLIFESRCG